MVSIYSPKCNYIFVLSGVSSATVRCVNKSQHKQKKVTRRGREKKALCESQYIDKRLCYALAVLCCVYIHKLDIIMS